MAVNFPRILFYASGWEISGGVRNIVEIGNLLQERGHKIAALSPDKSSPWYDINFPYFDVYRDAERFEPDVIIGTFFATCKEVLKIANCLNIPIRGYLVQHDERISYGQKAEWTYFYPWDFCITISPWLENLLRSFGQTKIGKFTPAVPHDIFKPYNNKEINRVVFYSNDNIRKEPEIGLKALEIVKKEIPEVEIHTFDKAPAPKVDFPIVHHKNIFGEELARLYSSATVMMQSTPVEGYGTMSLEPMACGTAVVTPDKLGTEEFPKDTVLYAEVNPENIAKNVIYLLKSKAEREKREKAGLKYAKTITFEKAAENVERFLLKEVFQG